MSLLNKSYIEICGESEDRKWVTSCKQSDLTLVCDFPRTSGKTQTFRSTYRMIISISAVPEYRVFDEHYVIL